MRKILPTKNFVLYQCSCHTKRSVRKLICQNKCSDLQKKTFSIEYPLWNHTTIVRVIVVHGQIYQKISRSRKKHLEALCFYSLLHLGFLRIKKIFRCVTSRNDSKLFRNQTFNGIIYFHDYFTCSNFKVFIF